MTAGNAARCATPPRGPPSSPSRAPAPPNDIAVRFGLLGGGFASAFVVLPPLLADGGGGALTDYAGLMVAMLAIWMGSRALGVAHPGLPYTRRLVLGSTIAAFASALVGCASYALYAWLRPGLLAERYAALQARLRASAGIADAPGASAAAGADGPDLEAAAESATRASESAARAAAELDRLEAQKAQYLDPAFQALGTAGTLFFFGTILALYAAWRWRVILRLQAARAVPPDATGPDENRPGR